MAKIQLALVPLFLLLACGGGENNAESGSTREAPAAIENSTQHPNGITGGSVISTDTAAMRVDTTGKSNADSSSPK